MSALREGPSFYSSADSLPQHSVWHIVGPQTNACEINQWKRVSRACGKSTTLGVGGLKSSLISASDPLGDPRQAINFHRLPGIPRISSNSKRVPSSRMYLLYLLLCCVDPSINLHLRTKCWAKPWCLSDTLQQRNSVCWLPYSFRTYCVPSTNNSANNPTQDGQEKPARLSHPTARHALDVLQSSCSGAG